MKRRWGIGPLTEKSKPGENRGRKAMGLKAVNSL
jgi:hypothetical protein